MASASRIMDRSRVPSGRAERLAKIGWLAGRMALGAAAEGARRLGRAEASRGHVLLTAANARRLAGSLSSMRGAAMKLGQLLSLESEDFLPPEAALALANLRDAADAMPSSQLHGVLREAWGSGWEGNFRSFDFEPIAAASIGQVHTATTTDGRELALKIQYPGVARSIDSDVDNLATALRMARILPGEIDFGPLIEEAKRQLRDEADYETEAGHLRRYAALLADEPEVVVPDVHEDLSTSSILAMDRLHGVPLEDLCSPEYSDAERNRAAALLLRLVLREFFEFHFVQSDPNFANYLLLRDGRIGLIDLGAGYAAPPALCRGYADLFRACADDDHQAQRAIATQIGFLGPSDGAGASQAMIDLISLATEPFRHEGLYDFGRSDLPARAREGSMALVFEHGFWRPPPPETLFLQRKLGGTFLLCTRLRARVDARALLEEALDAERLARQETSE
ncbi:MAG: AarF/ABC1/UbiB kinase family protein [Gammaproteobacteria bacterium]|nr:AarF/ABC1/UbiB kinase family protein [Gammaproteobacteria bacterium]